VLEGADQVLSDKREREGQRSDKQLAAKDDRIRHLEEVTAELSMEVLQLKKRVGRSDGASGVAPGERRGGVGRPASSRASFVRRERVADDIGSAALNLF
jgi:hypothetical protein